MRFLQKVEATWQYDTLKWVDKMIDYAFDIDIETARSYANKAPDTYHQMMAFSDQLQRKISDEFDKVLEKFNPDLEKLEAIIKEYKKVTGMP